MRRSTLDLSSGPKAVDIEQVNMTFERTVPQDYLMRLAASDVGKSYKSLALSELGVMPGDIVVDLGCGPGADLVSFAEPTGPTGRVIGIDVHPDAVNLAAPLLTG